MNLEDANTQIDLAFTRKDRRGLTFENAFSGVQPFMRGVYSKDIASADLVVAGIRFDQAVKHRPRTRFGLRAIREAST